jgi:hypothetical protein
MAKPQNALLQNLKAVAAISIVLSISAISLFFSLFLMLEDASWSASLFKTHNGLLIVIVSHLSFILLLYFVPFTIKRLRLSKKDAQQI